MRRRDLFALLATAPALLTASDMPRPAGPGTRYYVSPTGDDRASGRSPATAWRSINQVNNKLADGTVGHPDAVLFESGQTFYGKLRAPKNAPTDHGYLTFGSFAPGGVPSPARPVISSYLQLGAPRAWRPAGQGIWLAEPGGGHPGYDGGQGGRDNIGFLKVDGTINGRRVWNVGELADQWDFHCEPGALRVRSSANPAHLASKIEASSDGDCITVGNALCISGLTLTGSGGHGVAGTGSDVLVVNNEFAELGGSRLFGTTRYGNGYQAWIGSARATVANNTFHDIYDVAMTAQGRATPDADGWSDLTLRNNLVYRCNQSVEFWSEGASGPGFARCLVERNTCLFAGYGWSAPLRPDRQTRVHLLTYGWDLPADITVRNNTFYDAALAYRYSSVPTPGLRCADNTIAQRAGRALRVRQPETIEQWSRWVSAEHNDSGSRFQVLPPDAPLDVRGVLRTLAS